MVVSLRRLTDPLHLQSVAGRCTSAGSRRSFWCCRPPLSAPAKGNRGLSKAAAGTEMERGVAGRGGVGGESSNLARRAGDEANYDSWTMTELIQRVRTLEEELRQVRSSAAAASPVVSQQQRQQQLKQEMDGSATGGASAASIRTKPDKKRKMDRSRYSTRFVALKLAYLGKRYGGFEFQAMANQPSIEEELWKALTKACLIFPDGDAHAVQFDGCEYSKCGRTDRGVSAFGQVLGLRVRSNRPLPCQKRLCHDGDAATTAVPTAATPAGSCGAGTDEGTEEHESNVDRDGHEAGTKAFDDIADELCYPRILNRLLPSDIRILAWCPSPPPGFSARFSCRERQYRYYFTQPAFAPSPAYLESASPSIGGIKPGWLDIHAMRDAAKRFEGEHDFRNFCKIDPAKQITNFHRRIFEADVVHVDHASPALPFLQNHEFAKTATGAGPGPFPQLYFFHVRGSAFLWHQIRHMVAVLFLVGQGLERPELVSQLLDVAENPRRPAYTMADEVPLVLWDCIFPCAESSTEAVRRDDELTWIYIGEESDLRKFGHFGVVDELWGLWRERKMDEVLVSQLLAHVSQQGEASRGSRDKLKNSSVRLFEGGCVARLGGKYVPVMSRELLQSPEEQNERYAKRKCYASAEAMRAQKGMGKARTDGKEKEEEGEQRR